MVLLSAVARANYPLVTSGSAEVVLIFFFWQLRATLNTIGSTGRCAPSDSIEQANVCSVAILEAYGGWHGELFEDLVAAFDQNGWDKSMESTAKVWGKW